MTWRLRVQGVVIAILVLGALAAASGATWTDLFNFSSYTWTDAADTSFGW
jgi:hypothetical protein